MATLIELMHLRPCRQLCWSSGRFNSWPYEEIFAPSTEGVSHMSTVSSFSPPAAICSPRRRSVRTPQRRPHRSPVNGRTAPVYFSAPSAWPPRTRTTSMPEGVHAFYDASVCGSPGQPQGPGSGRRCQSVVGLVRNTRRNLPIWISSPFASTAECTCLRLT